MSYITHRPQKRLPYVAEITDPATGKVDHTKSFATKGAAKNYLTEHEHQKLQGNYVSPRLGRVTAGERWDSWWPGVRGTIRPSSAARDESYWKSLVTPAFAAVPIGEIDHDRIQRWVGALIERGYAPATVHKAHGVLSKLLKGAVKAGLLGSNPCEHTELPEIVLEEMEFLTYDEVEELVDVFPYEPDGLLTRTGSYTGMRIGELFGLPVRHVFDNYLLVAQKVTEVSGRQIITPYLKTENRNAKEYGSWRKIPVPPLLTEMLFEHSHGKDRDDMVFTAPKGGMVRLAAWRRRNWYPATVAVGRGAITACTLATEGSCPFPHYNDKPSKTGHYEGLRVHDLRHTAVSFWRDQGRSIQEITEFLGHKDSQLQDRRYSHRQPLVHDEKNEAMNGAMAAAMARKNKATVSPIRRTRRVA